MRRNTQQQPRAKPSWTTRKGTVVLMASGMMVMVFGFAAFSVDVGYIALTKTQLQAADDGATLAAGMELLPGLGLGAWKTPEEVKVSAGEAAKAVAAANRAGDQPQIYADPNRDLRFGQYTWNATTGAYEKVWGATPYNMVEVTLRRDQEIGAPDGPLPLFFAPVIGHRNASLSVKATAALLPGIGMRIQSGSGMTAEFLPFTLDEETWNMLVAGTPPPVGDVRTYQDKFGYDYETKTVTHSADGIYEVNLFPEGNPSQTDYPPGNRGTVDLGGGNNSTNEIERQILYGCNEQDLVPFGGELIATKTEPLYINGDTGVSAGYKDELESIKGGTVRLIPIFESVSQNGDNAMYKIIKFAPARVMEVKMVGNPKRIIIQPAPLASSTVVPAPGLEITSESYFTTSRLVP